MKGVHWYIMLNLVLTGIRLGVLLTFEKSINAVVICGYGFAASPTVWAGLFEGRRWAWPRNFRWAYLAVCATVFHSRGVF